MVKIRVTIALVAALAAVVTTAAAVPLRLQFAEQGPIVSPDARDGGEVSLALRVLAVSLDGQIVPVGIPRLVTGEDRAEYDFGPVRLTYLNTDAGLKQTMTITAAARREKTGALSVVGVDFSVGGNLTPVKAGYFVDLFDAAHTKVLRLGPIDAKDADGKKLVVSFEVVEGDADGASGVRVVVEAIDPAYPIDVQTTLAVAMRDKAPILEAIPGEIMGVPVTLGMGITQTVEQIMEKERFAPPPLLALPAETHHELELDLELKDNPDAPPPMSHWPPIADSFPAALAGPSGPTLLPQTVGTSFKAAGLSESGAIPPDSNGDVGPTQVLVHINGRIKVFSKAGVLGALNASDGTFWAPVTSGISDPQVRYDRLSARWYILAISLESTNNKIVVAVSSGPTITGAASFTFYSFNIGTPSPSDASYFCDYPGFGVDANALYTGCNMFGASFHTSAFVIRKSSVTGGGPIVVTGFFNIGSSSSAGPYAPRGVDNDDPTATTGFIIGTDPGFSGRINIRKVSNPGGAPTLGSNITLNVSNTSILNQSALGSSTAINSSDIRIFAATIRKNKITGVASLWTAHSVETDTTCTPDAGSNNRRLGAKWYEIGNLTGTPSITQFGTLCTTAAGSATSNTERGFLYPTVTETGQGHMALSASHSSATEFVGIAAAGRLRTDPAAGTRAPETIVIAGAASYTLLDPNRNRWGDYSHTDVDPSDDQTVWTFQEYVDSTNNWAVQAVQLKAPPPPTTASSSNPVCLGVTAAPVTINGGDSCPAPTCTNGLCTGGGACPEFFDPGPDTGGPGFSNHLAVTVTGSITVNSATIVTPANPASQRVLGVTLSLNTTATTAGTKTVSIINPDGQARSYNNVITVVANRIPVANTGAPYSSCQNGSVSLNGTASTDPDITCGDSITLYEWDVNNDGVYDVTGSTPTLTWAQLSGFGLVVGPNTIKLRVTDSHAATGTSTGTLTISAEGTSCSDGNACTQTDTCQTGVCVGSNPVVCTPLDQCHDAGVCSTGTGACSNPNKANGSACNDANACTQSDTCQTGLCTGANPVVCNDGNSCTTDTCNPATGACSSTNAADGSACSDSNLCTQTDACQSGACVGSNPLVCVALNQCHVAGTCNPGTGACTNPNAPDGTTCSDGNLCTQTDACMTGTCVGTNPVVCTASDQCHSVGTCTSGTGVCTNPTKANGTACTDGNACTQNDTCQSGTCTGANPVICNDSNVCTTDSCNTGTGACSFANVADGTGCTDSNACTQSDACQAGVCTGASPVICTALDPCHSAGTCDTGTGVCTNPNAADGKVCSDGNACTQTDACQTGVCTGANPVVCGALDQCHVAGTCNTGTGVCSNPNAPNGSACTDGNACTQTDTCQSGACFGTNPVNCSDGIACTTDACDPGTGACSNVAIPDGGACSDGDATTCGDICTTGACAGHAVAEPLAIDVSLRVNKSPTDATVTWTDAPGPYNAYRGLNGPGGTPWTYNHTCLASGVVSTDTADAAMPAPGKFFYYLVTRVNECRESIPGSDSQSNPIPNASPCPVP